MLRADSVTVSRADSVICVFTTKPDGALGYLKKVLLLMIRPLEDRELPFYTTQRETVKQEQVQKRVIRMKEV